VKTCLNEHFLSDTMLFGGFVYFFTAFLQVIPDATQQETRKHDINNNNSMVCKFLLIIKMI
jgi:hypothetical protein